MNVNYFSLNNQIAALLPDVTQRAKVLAAAVGVALSRAAPLPSSPVDEPANYYNLQVLSSIKDAVGSMNENLVLDTKDSLEWTRNLWLVRYTAAHPQAYVVMGVTSGNFLEALINADVLLSTDARGLLNLWGSQIFALSMEVQAALSYKGQ